MSKTNKQTLKDYMSKEGVPSIEALHEQIITRTEIVFGALNSIFGALEKINTEEDFEISEYLDEIKDSLEELQEGF